jgi:hypothetical protein
MEQGHKKLRFLYKETLTAKPVLAQTTAKESKLE